MVFSSQKRWNSLALNTPRKKIVVALVGVAALLGTGFAVTVLEVGESGSRISIAQQDPSLASADASNSSSHVPSQALPSAGDASTTTAPAAPGAPGAGNPAEGSTNEQQASLEREASEAASRGARRENAPASTSAPKPSTATSSAPAAAPKPAEKSSPTPAPAPSNATTGQTAGSSSASATSALVSQINAERAARGIAPLRTDGNLQTMANEWSRTISSKRALVHRDVNGVLGQGLLGGLKTFGENLFVGNSGARAGDAVVAWMNSAPHRANMLQPGFDRVGIGVSKSSDGRVWVVAEFGGSANAGAMAGGIPSAQPVVTGATSGPVL